MGKSERSEGLQPAGDFIGEWLSKGKEVPSTCSEHGPFIARTFMFRGEEKLTRCTACLEREGRERVQEKLRHQQTYGRQERVEALFQLPRIPQDFVNENFDNHVFVSDPDMREAQKAVFSVARMFAENFDKVLKERGSLLLLGGFGTGKSRLAACVSNHLVGRGYTSMFLTAQYIVNRLGSARSFRSGEGPEDVIRELVGIDLLIIDELEEIYGEREREDMLGVFVSRYAKRAPVIGISNLSLDELRGKIGAKITDRLSHNGAQLPFTWGSYRRREPGTPATWMTE